MCSGGNTASWTVYSGVGYSLGELFMGPILLLKWAWRFLLSRLYGPGPRSIIVLVFQGRGKIHPHQ